MAVEFEVPLTAEVVEIVEAAPWPPWRMVTESVEELGELDEDVDEDENDMLEALTPAMLEDKSSMEPLRLPLGTVLVAV